MQNRRIVFFPDTCASPQVPDMHPAVYFLRRQAMAIPRPPAGDSSGGAPGSAVWSVGRHAQHPGMLSMVFE